MLRRRFIIGAAGLLVPSPLVAAPMFTRQKAARFAPILGPVDVSGVAPVIACGLRRLVRSYNGPMCNLRRSSDSATQDFWPDAEDNLPMGSVLRWAAGAASILVTKLYDQSGNATSVSQATAANQPPLALPGINGRPSLNFTRASSQQLAAPNVAAAKNIFDAGGTFLIVMNPTNTASGADVIFTAGSYSMPLVNGSLNVRYNQGATGAGLWQTTSQLTQVPTVVDLQYAGTALANVPVISFNGTSQTFSISTQPTGTITANANPPTIGGAANTAFPGHISEFIFWKSNTLPMAKIRRNCARYFGISVA